MNWKEDTWTYERQGTTLQAKGHSIKGILGISKLNAGWALVWLKKTKAIVRLPRLQDCKAFGAKILPLFDDNGDLQDAALNALKMMVRQITNETKGVQAEQHGDVDIVEVPKLTRAELPDQTNQKLPVTLDDLRRYLHINGTPLGVDRYRFVRSHYSEAIIIATPDNWCAAMLYDALDTLLWCTQGFDPDVTQEQLIEWIKTA